MRTIINGNSVPLKWFFIDAVTGTDFDFNHAEVKLTLYSCNYKKELGCSINGNILETTLPSYLPVGVYSMECTYWIGLGAKRANVIIHEAFQVSRNTAVQPIVNELEFTSIATPIFTTKIATVEYVTEKRYKELEASESLGRCTIYVVKSESGAETMYLYNKVLGGEAYLPDEEDITLAEKTEEVENEFGELVEQTSMVYKFKDRDTNKGKGYIILRTEKSIYEQMVQENTIYEVRYNFDLLGNTLNVPSNSTLLFNGGMLFNGGIYGIDTSIQASSVKIFSSVTLNGRFSVQEFDACWFGVNYNLSNNASHIKSAIDSVPSYSVIKFSKNNICKCTSNVGVSKEGVTILNANIQGPNSATFDVSANHITFESCKFYNCSQVIRLFTANDIKITGCYFKSCSYSIIQQMGYVSSNVMVDRCICEDAVADFVEANCTASAPSKNWTISNNHFLGSRSYPTKKTEERFVGITAVKNVLITNNIVERVAGDAAVHLEDVGSTAIVSNNIFDNIVGTGCIYTMHNNWDTLVIGNTFKNTDNTNYVVWFEGNTNSKKMFVNNLVIGSLTPVYWGDSGFNVIKDNTFIGTKGIDLEVVYDMDISGNTFRSITTPVGSQSGTSWRGNPKFKLRNNIFEDTRASYCVYCPRNSSSGVGHTKDAVIIGNVFDKGVVGNGNNSNLTDVGKVYINDNVLLSGSIDFSGATIGTNNKVFS